jgi:predicted AlkP superfamily phosphohydrolase/phosphomutase
MMQIQLARSTVLEQHDWKRTRALALPTDQYGFGRINLAGRERDGVVAHEKYADELDEIESGLRDLTNERGEPLVERIVRPIDDPRAAARTLPDMLVHWSLGIHEVEVTTRPVDVDVHRVAAHRTGQHTGNAFCVAWGPAADYTDDAIPTHELHKVIVSGVAGNA